VGKGGHKMAGKMYYLLNHVLDGLFFDDDPIAQAYFKDPRVCKAFVDATEAWHDEQAR